MGNDPELQPVLHFQQSRTPANSYHPAQAELATLIAASPGDPLIVNLAAEAAQASRTEYCSWCTQHGGSNDLLCRPNGVHYCRIAAAHQAGKISDAHLVAVQVVLGSPAPHREMLLIFERDAAVSDRSP